MKKPGIILAVTLFVFSGSNAVAQNAVKEIKLDKSPLDISYFKHDEKPLAKVQYARPARNGRKVFGELEKYGKVWRTGANESTEIRFYTDATFGGKQIPAGTYSLFTIPNEGNWTVIINSATDGWGAYSYDQGKDVARVEVPAQRTSGTVERLTLYFEGDDPAKTNQIGKESCRERVWQYV